MIPTFKDYPGTKLKVEAKTLGTLALTIEVNKLKD